MLLWVHCIDTAYRVETITKCKGVDKGGPGGAGGL